MTDAILTQNELKELLNYNPDTGIFTWKLPISNRIKVGDVAGSKFGKGYIAIKVNRKRYPAHRLAWLYIHGKHSANVIDHINMVRDDNRIENLREATLSQNQLNRVSNKNNTSGYKGVTFNKAENKWQVQPMLNGKYYYLGLFASPKLASEAYQAFCMVHHGEFYRVNIK